MQWLDSLINSLQSVLLSLDSWFSNNGQALNPNRSDAILLGTSKHNFSLDHITCVDVAGTSVILSNNVKHLCVILDSNLTFNKNVSSICEALYYHIRDYDTSVLHSDMTLPSPSVKLWSARDWIMRTLRFTISRIKLHGTLWGSCCSPSTLPY